MFKKERLWQKLKYKLPRNNVTCGYQLIGIIKNAMHLKKSNNHIYRLYTCLNL